MGYAIWKYVHVLLLVFWIGTDLGVALLTRKFTDAKLSLETRLTLLQMALIIDTLPRIAFLVMLPVGLHLMAGLGIIPSDALHLGAAWVIALSLLAVNIAAAKNMGTPKGAKLQKLNWALLSVVGAVLIALCAMGLMAADSKLPGWLATKMVLYGLVYFFAIGIDYGFAPLGGQIAELQESGSSPDLETRIQGTVRRTLFSVYGVYAGALLAALFGIGKFY